ncbi:MAG: VIT1/CCC1 transporter family protein [Acidobacteriota bacterium]
MAEENEEARSGNALRWLRNLRDERRAAAVYEALAQAEKDAERASLFRDLAAVETRHAEVWEGKLRDAGVKTAAVRPGVRDRLLLLLARRFGTAGVLPILEAAERNADGSYADQADARAVGMDREEKVHARVFETLGASGSAAIARQETWHRSSRGGSLRAAVFGMNDGLVSNFSLIMGVAGAGPGRGVLLLTGAAGMLAGAFSMAAGEYVSVRSQRELYEHEIRKEEEELRNSPEEEARELELIYRAKGIPREQAAALSRAIVESPHSALDTLAREELGLDPGDLGSPWAAASSSFFAFVAGAFIPLAPFLILEAGPGVAVSASLSAAALLAVGGLLAFFTGRSVLYGALRMAAIGGTVALVTHLLGRLIGVSLG